MLTEEVVQEALNDVIRNTKGFPTKNDSFWFLQELINEHYKSQSHKKESVQRNDIQALERYKNLKQDKAIHDILYKMICYSAVDAYIEEPADLVYKTIADNCIKAFLKADECDLIKLADIISFKYSKNELTLDMLNKMSNWDILGLMY